MSYGQYGPLHWGIVDETINVSGVNAVNGEIGPVQGEGNTVVVQPVVRVPGISGSGGVRRISGSSGVGRTRGSGGVCG